MRTGTKGRASERKVDNFLLHHRGAMEMLCHRLSDTVNGTSPKKLHVALPVDDKTDDLNVDPILVVVALKRNDEGRLERDV